MARAQRCLENGQKDRHDVIMGVLRRDDLTVAHLIHFIKHERGKADAVCVGGR